MVATMSGFVSRLSWLVLVVLSFVHECQSYDDFCPKWYGYRCADGACIRRSFLCDKWDDCVNGDDEANCIKEASSYRCPPWRFPCEDKSRCVSITFRCDGTNECFDGSDEANCPPEDQCGYPYIACQTGDQCIHSNHWCDRNEDCQDGSDESNCMGTRCGEDSFNCGNGTCIPDSWRCDGTPDCNNGSEEACPFLQECLSRDRRCKRSRECIPRDNFCDGEPLDCRDGSDEEDCPVTNVPQTST